MVKDIDECDPVLCIVLFRNGKKCRYAGGGGGGGGGGYKNYLKIYEGGKPFQQKLRNVPFGPLKIKL